MLLQSAHQSCGLELTAESDQERVDQSHTAHWTHEIALNPANDARDFAIVVEGVELSHVHGRKDNVIGLETEAMV